MKNHNYLFAILLLINIISNLSAQSGWFAQFTPRQTAFGFSDMYFNDQNTGWLIGEDSISEGVVFHTTNSGTNWYLIYSTPNAHFSSVFFTSISNGYIVNSLETGTSIYKTTNAGINWFASYVGEPVNLVTFTNQDTGYLTASMSSDIYKTTNAGLNWIMSAMGSSSQKNSMYFVSNDTGWVCCNNGIVMKTTSGGTDFWQVINTPTYCSLYSIFFIDVNTGWAVGSQKKILKSTNGGENWFSLNNIDTSNYASPLESVFFVSSNTGWIACRDTILYTTNGGTNWIAQRPTLNSSFYGCIKFVTNNIGWVIDGENSILYKTTNGGNPTGIKPISNETPATFNLSQNYPNPFNPVTSMNFDIPKTSFTKLIIYDVTGREIQTLVNQELIAGTYKVDFQGNSLSSGVYFYRLQTNDFIQTRKMVLLK